MEELLLVYIQTMTPSTTRITNIGLMGPYYYKIPDIQVELWTILLEEKVKGLQYNYHVRYYYK